MSENDIRAAKKLVFRKQLGKTLANCDPPQPEQPDIIFFPSNNSAEFVNLVGLEQVVTHIKAMNAKKKPTEKKSNDELATNSSQKSPEKEKASSATTSPSHSKLANSHCWAVQPRGKPDRPLECENCGIDFSPQWHRDEVFPDKVYCINCVNTHCKTMQKASYRVWNEVYIRF